VTRGLAAATAGCLVSGTLLVLAEGRPWRVVRYAPGLSHDVTGHAVASSLSAWGLVALAGVVAVAATRRWMRLPVGLLLAASGAAATAYALRGRHARVAFGFFSAGPATGPVTTHDTVWPWVAVAAGALLAATGVLVALRGPRWSAMPARYDAPVAAPPAETDLWGSLDRGEDPTA
jgi:uncharacterized membrane protein (TIGR02234 family)